MRKCRRLLLSLPRGALAFAIVVSAVGVFPRSGSAGQRGHRSASSFDRGRRDHPQVALTFDGGSDAGESERILEVLEQRGVTATFFLTGEYIRRYPQLVRRIVASGHEIGNHTWSHPHLTSWDQTRRHRTLPRVSRASLLEELERTALLYEAVTGRRMAALWRAPFGEINGELLDWAASAGWSHVGWTRDEAGGRGSLDSLDWVAERSSRNYLSSEQIAARILAFGAGRSGLNGGIVLMHLCTRRVDPQVTRLGDLISSLQGRGYSLVTVTELRNELEGPAAVAAALGP